jgi:hypothetical protein
MEHGSAADQLASAGRWLAALETLFLDTTAREMPGRRSKTPVA